MKVLMTADPVGGVWTFALELCAGLAGHGVRVALATLGAPLTTAQRLAAAAVPGLELEESAFRLEWMAEPWADLERAGRWLLRLEREHRPDVIHLNHLVHGELPWRAPVLITGHSCVASWWQAVHGTALPAEWATYEQRVTRSLRAADCVSAPTRAMLSQLRGYYGPLPLTAVVPNGRDPARFSRAHSKEHLVLCAGRLWDAAKNVQALGAVAPLLDWPVCIAGECTSPDGARADITATNLHLLGTLAPQDLALWYGRAAIYALPARYEPFGLTALEAALSGCALLLGDIPSLREVWGGAACYVAPDDHEHLRERLSELIGNDAARTELAARAAEIAARLSPESTVRGYLRLYRCMTGQPARSELTHAARA
jgi:glycosyltransferase involved in cell wall biosynthesis